MKNFDNFDESVKHKMDGMNFQFNEANWEKMSEMIDASRPAKKPLGKLLLISSIVVGSALIIGSAWYIITNSSDTKEVAQNTQAVVVEANSNTNNEVVNSNVTSNSSVNTNINSSNETNTSTNNNFSNPITSSNSNTDVSKTKHSDRAVKNEVSDVNANTVAKKGEDEKSIVNSDDKSLAQKTTSNNDNNTDANTFNTNVPVGATEGAKMKLYATMVNNNDKSDNTTSVNPESNTTALQTNQQVAEEKNINADEEESELVALPSVTTNLGQTAETIAAANLKTAALEEKKAWEYVRVKHHTFGIEGGAINSFGWAVNKTRNGNNISPVLGINYMYNFNSRSSLMIGLQYNSIANLGEAKANFSVTTYGFGANNDVTTYKLNDLHYAVMPIKYIHRINKNNALGFGANMMYLMNTRTQITKTTILESNVSTSESHFEMGYGFDQLNSINTQLAVSYHHNINNKLAINAELNKALLNVVKDYKYYGAKNTSSAPAAIKLSLTYTLFNK